jgi:hypothetical protein
MTEKRNTDLSPLANAYLFGGLGSVALLGLVLAHSGGRWALFPVLIAAAGLAYRWRPAPFVVLAGIALGHIVGSTAGDYDFVIGALFGRHSPWPTEMPLEVTACALTLAYVVAHYRLLGLTAGTFPSVPRHEESSPPRSGTVAFGELVNGLFTVATATIGAFFLWRIVGTVPAPWNIIPSHWRVGLLAWLLIGDLVLTATVMNHLGWRRQSRAEATLFLQDTLWHETRREQRRINRWRAWALRRR